MDLLRDLVDDVLEDAQHVDEEPRDALLAALFEETPDEDTPLEAALRGGGQIGGTGDSAVKLFCLECLTFCGPIRRFEDVNALSETAKRAHVPRLANSLRDQVLMFMPQLGALARPYEFKTDREADATFLGNTKRHFDSTTLPYKRLSESTESVGDNAAAAPGVASALPGGKRRRGTSIFDPEAIEKHRMRDWLACYVELPHEAIGLCVSYAFYKEYAAMKRLVDEFGASGYIEQRERRAAADYSPKFPNDKPRGVGRALLLSLQLAKDANRLAAEDDDAMRTHDAAKHRELSKRLQLAAAAALDDLGDDVTYLLFKHHNGLRAMQMAVLESHHHFLAEPAVRGAVKRLWLGEVLYHLTENEGSTVGALLEYIALAALNLLALPFIAATPRQYSNPTAAKGWVRLFGNSTFYLLQVAHFQAFLYTFCDLMLTLLVTMYNDELPLVGLVWTLSAVAFEAGQIRRAMKNQSVTERLGTLQTYLSQDLFNAVDMPTLLLVLFAFLSKIYLLLYTLSTASPKDAEALLSAQVSSSSTTPPIAAPAASAASSVLSGTSSAEKLLTSEAMLHADLADDLFLPLLPGFEAFLRALISPLNGLTNIGTSRSIALYLQSIDEPLTATAILFLWFRQLRLLTYLHKGMSDLVQLIGRMLVDVMQFMGLFSVILFGFAAAFQYLVNQSDVENAEAEQDEVCAQILSELNHLLLAMPFLFAAMLTGNVGDAMACFRDTPHSMIGALLFYFFLVLSVLLMLNMIIAMMGRTFSAFEERAQQEGAVYFARVVADWYDQKAQPPPFNALVLVGSPISMLLRFASKQLEARGWIVSSGGRGGAGSTGGSGGSGGAGATGKGGGAAQEAAEQEDDLSAASEGENDDFDGNSAPASARASTSNGRPPMLAEMSRHSHHSDSHAHHTLAGRLLGGEVSVLSSWKGEGPEGAPSMDGMKDTIGDMLQEECGEWETTAFLIDRAVTTLTDEIESHNAVVMQHLALDLRKLTKALIKSGALPKDTELSPMKGPAPSAAKTTKAQGSKANEYDA